MGKKVWKKIFFSTSFFFSVYLAKKIFGLFVLRRSPILKNLKEFLRKEEKEVNELKNNQENLSEYCHDTYNIFRDYFIPCDCNKHHPRILRARSLVLLTFLVLVFKIITVSYVFFVYPNAGKMSAEIEMEELALINSSREVEGINSLEINDYLNRVALAKANDMLERDYFAHETPSGKMPWDLIDRNSYAYIFVGENLAMNFSTADSAHKALMLSPSHKKNIINPKYSEIGIAVVRGELNGEETNVMVQVFGARPMSSTKLASGDTSTAGTTKVATEEVIAKEPETKGNIKVASVEDNIKTTEIIPEVIEKVPAKISVEQIVKNDEVIKPPLNQTPASTTIIAKTESIISEDKANDSSLVLQNELSEELINKSNIENLNIQPVAYNRINESTNDDVSRAIKMVRYAKYFSYFVLGFLFISLLINIFYRVTVQHKPAIAQTLISLAIIALIIFTRVSFLENIADSVMIL